MNFSGKKILTTLLFFTLMLFKVSAFHVYSHQDDSSVEQCSICDVAIYTQDVELSASPLIIVPSNITPISSYERQSMIVSSFPITKVCHTLYGRPPPTLD